MLQGFTSTQEIHSGAAAPKYGTTDEFAIYSGNKVKSINLVLLL